MKNQRFNKNKKALQRMKERPVEVINRNELDKNIFDTVLQALYLNANKNELDLEKEIFAPYHITITSRESERLWNVLTSSGWVVPAVGFGKAGKLELTKAGFQLMSQFGSYKEYLASVQTQQQQPQTIIMPISMPDGHKPGEIIPLSAKHK